MDLLQILVLAQVRLCKNTTYDELHYMANQDRLLQQLLGIEIDYSFKEHFSLKQTEITYQKIIDNLSLLDDKDSRELNKIIIDFGHEVFKKEGEAEDEIKPLFKKLRNKRSTVESNINELEYRGLDRCPNRGLGNFKRYVGLSIGAYNFKKIGEKLLEHVRKQEAARGKLKAA